MRRTTEPQQPTRPVSEHLTYDGYVAPGRYTFMAAGGYKSQFPVGIRTLGGPIEVP